MARPRRLVNCPRDPVGLSREEAAAFISVSAETFEKAVNDGLMPKPRILGARLIWIADEVMAALNALPVKGAMQVRKSGAPWGMMP